MGASVRSVLVVDDDEQVLAACKRSTSRELAIDACTDPDEARRLAADKDLVIVDLKLGDHSGLELVRELRGDRPELEIALISGFLSVDSIVAAVKAGARVGGGGGGGAAGRRAGGGGARGGAGGAPRRARRAPRPAAPRPPPRPPPAPPPPPPPH